MFEINILHCDFIEILTWSFYQNSDGSPCFHRTYFDSKTNTTHVFGNCTFHGRNERPPTDMFWSFILFAVELQRLVPSTLNLSCAIPNPATFNILSWRMKPPNVKVRVRVLVYLKMKKCHLQFCISL
jgi:hypothetical protein